jgi:hypothetical protein
VSDATSEEELGLEVACGGAIHRIQWTRRGLDLLGHPGGREEDDVLVALSGEAARCRRIEEAWTELEDERALELLDADHERLAAIARRLPIALDQRERVRRRDDLSDEQRAAALHGFDQMTHLAELAALGQPLARQRALDAVDRLWRRRAWATTRPRRQQRRRGRQALVDAAARAAGTSAATIVFLPSGHGPTVVVRVRGRIFGVVSRPWLKASAA